MTFWSIANRLANSDKQFHPLVCVRESFQGRLIWIATRCLRRVKWKWLHFKYSLPKGNFNIWIGFKFLLSFICRLQLLYQSGTAYHGQAACLWATGAITWRANSTMSIIYSGEKMSCKEMSILGLLLQNGSEAGWLQNFTWSTDEIVYLYSGMCTLPFLEL